MITTHRPRRVSVVIMAAVARAVAGVLGIESGATTVNPEPAPDRKSVV